ncbi:juvenile hormone epoxide hydrolase 2-like isoform X1 [Harmonia axyridis]|uniref:juvenile hormone epoxide hydrolase 2-like isoform X1 n=1 Tax=Harmonia axyridis TaxID=115357 RepID=UPI001E27769A|nr:juvenile hormone epoxide hydrolase 2-like isoform X1 [Harmonia axyridis]
MAEALLLLLLSVCAGLIILFAKKIWDYLCEVPPVPELKNTWWGPGELDDEDDCVRPFQINISDDVLDDLRHRLKNSRSLKPPLEGTENEYGINPNLTKQVVDYWLEKYDWRKREIYLNQLPHFKTKIQGLDIHFIHVTPKSSTEHRIIPLLLLHGWPGSFREFYEIIPILTNPQNGRDFVFEVVVPSLPGFGFSDAAVRPGLGPPQMAVVLKNLMLKLGKDRFLVQAGDWGSVIMSNMAILFPEHVIATHNNFCMDLSMKAMLKRFLYGLWPSLVVSEKYKHLVFPTTKFLSGLIKETGYYHIQATKPETLGAGLSDSPMGLAAYILEKFLDENGELTKKFTMDSLLDNVMIYWVTNSMTTAIRLYAQASHKSVKSLHVDRIPVPVPTGYARFVHDAVYSPEALLKDKYPHLIHVTDLEGGHFAAMECPQILANDLCDFTEKVFSKHHG